MGLGKIHMELFEAVAEKQLIQPTFITEFPKEVSPLARANDDNDFVTDRFEFYVVGQELANGFSELNDPEDQAERFAAQIAHASEPFVIIRGAWSDRVLGISSSPFLF